MAAIHDLIAQINDVRLRDRLAAEWASASRERKFGLVYEDHLPELLALPGVPARPGDLVCVGHGSLKEVWQVQSVDGKLANCVKPEDQTRPSDRQSATNASQSFPLASLVVVREFGEAVFPTLTPIDQVPNLTSATPWHTLIEADNYHALQLLEYLYAGKVDCIYIDPPYNTGARVWKYNNDYIDKNDEWRHSKWLAFMERRLRIAKRLLKPDIGVLIVTIDEHEVHHLGMLLEEIFPGTHQQLITIVINAKGVSQEHFSRVEEYALYCFNPEAVLPAPHDDLLSPDRSSQKRFQTPRWEWLQRGGNNATPAQRHGLFYPIHIDPEGPRIIKVGRPLPKGELPTGDVLDDISIAWPIRRDGSYATWQVGPETLERLIDNGFVRLGGYDKRRKTWTIQYLGAKAQRQIQNGDLMVVGTDTVRGCVQVAYSSAEQRSLKTVWNRPLHDSGVYGSSLLKTILGKPGSFSFPKSLYSTRDALAAVVRDRRDALIIDFFAGSGTTLNAVNLLNLADGGKRQCILVTNNEVSAEESDTLRKKGQMPGNPLWEEHGICRSVTWPRSKFTILGKRDDGTALPGDYFLGRTVVKEKRKSVTQVGFLPDPTLSLAQKRGIASLVGGMPQKAVLADSKFVLSPSGKTSILFDVKGEDDWIEALSERNDISELYVVEARAPEFAALKKRVLQAVGPSLEREDDKVPMSAGFEAGLAYFRLEFLDRDTIELRQSFSKILPLLWLKSGAIGERPTLDPGLPEPAFIAPEQTNFVVLLDETKLVSLLDEIKERSCLTYVFIVTDADESFREMSRVVAETIGEKNADLKVAQLYRDYISNFAINRASAKTLKVMGGGS